MNWFQQARYGLFIHWGPYAAGGRGEWVLNRERIPLADYDRLYSANFRAEAFDPAAWAQLARDAGMQYVVLTARHHDGFALWKTKTTPRNAVEMGPKRDLVAGFVDAVRAAGLKVGLYYSVADWSHPDYPGPFCRDWPTGWSDDFARTRFIDFYEEQLRELLSNYGALDVLWFDGCLPQPTDGAEINPWVKSVQPQILINDQNGEPFDFRVVKQCVQPPREGPWEACMTLNENWGYHAGDTNWKSPRQIVQALASTAGKAGNFLLNVGPRADGVIPEAAQQNLRAAGAWLKRNGDWLPGSGLSRFAANSSCLTTVNGSRVFLHFFNAPPAEFCYAELQNRVLSAKYLDGGTAIPFEQFDSRIVLKFPAPFTDPIATTVVLDVLGVPQAVDEKVV